jgi:hypothetical protein
MKTVIISRNDKELVRVPLNRQSLLAGRSPSCDAVVRYKGVKPVQFMIEHVSENLSEEPTEADFESGFWTLIDISEANTKEAEKRNASSGAGIVLDSNRQSFNGFDFKITTDALQETDLKKGVLSRSIDHSVVATAKEKNVIEVVYFRKDIDIVTNISHLNRKKTSKKIKLFPQQLPDFIFEWENSSDVKASIKTSKDHENIEVFSRGERITDDFKQSKTISIKNDDFIHIETESDDFYLRLVPEVDVGLEKFSWFNDFLIRITMGILAAITVFVFLIRNFTVPPEKPPEPPRLIKIELPAPPPALVEEPKPPAEELKLNQPELVVEKKEPAKKTDIAVEKVVKKEPVKAAENTVVMKPKEKPNLGVNNNSKPKDVNTMGLLAKLKNGQTATKQKVSADTILNQGVVSETLSGETGKVVIKKAPLGIIGKQKEPINPNGLAEASTTLSGAFTSDPKAGASLSVAGASDRFSTGTQLSGLKGNGGGGAGQTSGSGTAPSGSGFDRADAIQAVGGLDKDAIRKALRENRRAITNCYETALLTKKQLDGRMTFRWVISLEGNVSSIKLQNSELAMPNFEICVETVIKKIIFPQSPNKMTTTVIYPFAFQGKK